MHMTLEIPTVDMSKPDLLANHLISVINPVLSSMVEFPTSLEITGKSKDHTIFLSIFSDKRDTGKIIGRQGRNINAIRTLLAAIAARLGFVVVIEVIGVLDS